MSGARTGDMIVRLITSADAVVDATKFFREITARIKGEEPTGGDATGRPSFLARRTSEKEKLRRFGELVTKLAATNPEAAGIILAHLRKARGGEIDEFDDDTAAMAIASLIPSGATDKAGIAMITGYSQMDDENFWTLLRATTKDPVGDDVREFGRQVVEGFEKILDTFNNWAEARLERGA